MSSNHTLRNRMIARAVAPLVVLAGLLAVSPGEADAATPSKGPRVLVCKGKGAELTMTRNLRRGSCVYPVRIPKRATVAKQWRGYRVSVTRMTCKRGKWLAVDYNRRTRSVWAYCEGGKPTKAAKRYAKRHPYRAQHVGPRTSAPAPVLTCEQRAAAWPVLQTIGLSIAYDYAAPVCVDGELQVTAPQIVEDAYGFNCYRDGNLTCGDNLARYDAGCVTDRRDGYTMCRDGLVYLRTVKSGKVTRSYVVRRVPR